MSTVGSAGTSGSLGIPEPLAVHARPPVQHYDFNANAIPFEHARAPVQHYDFNANAIPFEHARAPMQHYDFNANASSFQPLSLKRGAAAPNAQRTFQHTSGAPLCREGQATKSQTSSKTSSARRQANQKSGTKVPGWRKASIPPGAVHLYTLLPTLDCGAHMHVLVFACHLALMSVTVHCLQSQAVEPFLNVKRTDAMCCFILRSTKWYTV